jgi:hypothetical protein
MLWPIAGQEIEALHALAEEAERRAKMWHEFGKARFPDTQGPKPKEFVQLDDGIGWDSSSLLELRFVGTCWRIEINADSHERLHAMEQVVEFTEVSQ